MATTETNTVKTPIAYDELAARCLERIDFIERVLHSFSDRFVEDLEQLERYVETEDVQAIARLAHRMKGACGNTAAQELHEQVSRIERLAREDRFAEILPSIAGIHLAWTNFCQAMTNLNMQFPAVSSKG